MVDRSMVVQEILDLFDRPSYLEIGVDQGETFRFVTAAHKVAVDPNFKFTPPPNTASVAFYPVTSDAYFGEYRSSHRFDVVYIDGLHTFEQTLRDLMNALLSLNHGGVVVVDDIMPVSYHSSLPSLDEAFRVRDHLAIGNPALVGDNTWMGDVYKIAFFVQTFVQQLSYATVSENHGQLVLWSSPRPEQSVTRTMLDVALLSYKDTVIRRDVFNIQPLATILASIEASKGEKA